MTAITPANTRMPASFLISTIALSPHATCSMPGGMKTQECIRSRVQQAVDPQSRQKRNVARPPSSPTYSPCLPIIEPRQERIDRRQAVRLVEERHVTASGDSLSHEIPLLVLHPLEGGGAQYVG